MNNIRGAEAVTEKSALFRGWYNYYRYARALQACFSRIV